MTINEFVEEFDDMSSSRCYKAFDRLVDYIKKNFDDIHSEDPSFLYGLFNYCSVAENDDFFGTEGLNV